ncbi:putative LEU2-beta-isopropyl-malate dehydrogenase [Fusarium austroafricanum]|uniref:Putative LEU2-beta-isopropyl-malate dehydrogenase n=1 Tax=Fusarium austroafricanum TaxID=2364996 RepID=A0A8H4NJJ7_9HYPO|nr:putative LEU2-beta-isopropyl-malate dehydrogenase [Fusarium austroafricanum]
MKTYDQMEWPRPFRNDCPWLAVDHIVDPRADHHARQKGLIAKAERFWYRLPASNTSTVHRDLIPGSTRSLAVGFGVADVVMLTIIGETWFRVPGVCRINSAGKLPFGVGGKDTILHILGFFKCNTIAFQRVVDYGDPGLKEPSIDARFAIPMTTEFGGMEPSILQRRGLAMALYPNPDDAVWKDSGMKLDGCFIGVRPSTRGKYRVTPGSLIIIKRQDKHGLLNLYGTYTGKPDSKLEHPAALTAVELKSLVSGGQ